MRFAKTAVQLDAPSWTSLRAGPANEMKVPPVIFAALAIAAMVAAGVAAAGSPLLALAVFGAPVMVTLILALVAARR